VEQLGGFMSSSRLAFERGKQGGEHRRQLAALAEPAEAVFIECHLVYEEAYGWFGINLVKQKMPVMVQEKVRTFRRKLALATGEQAEKK
jgi:hypothetical protein